jgi:hypothetical protein
MSIGDRIAGAARLHFMLVLLIGHMSLNACSRRASDQPAASNELVKTELSAAATASCEACRAQSCNAASYQGADIADGCLKAPDPKLVPHPDPNFIHDCKAAVECAYKHDCGYDPARGPVRCYCGSRALDECIKDGPADDAPCTAEWQAATRGKTRMEVLERFSEIEYPSGWAFALIECDRDRCGAGSAYGRCTP